MLHQVRMKNKIYRAIHGNSLLNKADDHFYSDLLKKILVYSYWDQYEYTKTHQRSYDMLHNHTPSITTTSHRRGNGVRYVNVMFTQRQTSKYQGNTQGWKQVPGTDDKITDN